MTRRRGSADDERRSAQTQGAKKEQEPRAGRWEIVLTDDFKDDVRKLDQEIARRVTTYLYGLRELEDPRVRGKALTGPLSGTWRFRIAKDYRILAKIDNGEVTILALRVRHRSKSYDD